MQVSVENVQGLERRLKVSVPVEVVNKTLEECFKKAAKDIHIHGFRPGKVPRKILEERYGASIRIHEAAPKIIDETLWDAFKKAEAAPVGRPSLEGPLDLQKDQPLNYSVLFDVLPEISLKNLSGKEVEQNVSEVTDADVDKAIEQLRQERATLVETDAPAGKDDVIVLSYTVEVDGKPVEQETAEKITVRLGSNSPLIVPELEEQLVGLPAANDEKILEATFPESYPAESVAGKKATFKVTIHTVKHAQLPELNDEFVNQFDGAKSVEDFRANIRKNMVYYLKNALASVNKINIFDALAEENPIDVPKSLVQAEVEHMAKGFIQSVFRKDDISDSELQKHLPFLTKFYKKPAENRIRLSLLVEECIKQHPQTITDEQIDQMAKERSELYQDPEAWIKEQMSLKENREQMRHILLELAIADILRQTANIKEVPLDYFAVLQKEQALQNRNFDGQDAEEEHVHDEHCQHDGHHHEHDHEHGEHCHHD